MEKKYITAIKKDVNNPSPAGETPAVGVDVYVYVKSTGAQAIIYSDNGVTQKSQPLTTDEKGQVWFYAANGRYNIEYQLPSGTQTDEDIALYDKDDDIATASEAGAGADDSKIMTPLKVSQYCSDRNVGALSLSTSGGGTVRVAAIGSIADNGAAAFIVQTNSRTRPLSISVTGSFSVKSLSGLTAYGSNVTVLMSGSGTSTVNSYLLVASSDLSGAAIGEPVILTFDSSTSSITFNF